MKMPWQYHPDLDEARLKTIAALIFRGRTNALDRYDTAIGDDSWTLGVCAFNYGRYEIIQAAQQGEHAWLSIADDSRRFVFRIGAIVVRFYRGDPQEPRPNMLNQVFDELRQLPLPLEDGQLLEGVQFRIAVETDEAGEILDISFVAIRNGITESVWEIPLDVAASTEELAGSAEADEVQPLEVELLESPEEDKNVKN